MPRLRVRRVDEGQLALDVLQSAIEANKTIIKVQHGGTVNNSYGYPADTECVVSVANPRGRVWTSDVKRIPANKATLGGAFTACTGFRGCFDGRFSKTTKSSVRKSFLHSIGM